MTQYTETNLTALDFLGLGTLSRTATTPSRVEIPPGVNCWTRTFRPFASKQHFFLLWAQHSVAVLEFALRDKRCKVSGLFKLVNLVLRTRHAQFGEICCPRETSEYLLGCGSGCESTALGSLGRSISTQSRITPEYHMPRRVGVPSSRHQRLPSRQCFQLARALPRPSLELP